MTQLEKLLRLAWFDSTSFGDDPRAIAGFTDVSDDLKSYTTHYKRPTGEVYAITHEGTGIPRPDGTPQFIQVMKGRAQYFNGPPIWYPPPADPYWTKFIKVPEVQQAIAARYFDELHNC